jgi:hypothetical protein
VFLQLGDDVVEHPSTEGDEVALGAQLTLEYAQEEVVHARYSRP